MDSGERRAIVDAAELLGQLLLQDVQRDGTGDGDDVDADGEVSLKDGVSKDRMVSVHDPQIRHGHKSKSRRFDGHKAAVDVLAGNAPDNLGALELVEQSEINADVPVVEAMGHRLRRRRHPPGFLPTRDVSWWPECQDGPTANTSPRKTSPSTWRSVPAPVRRGRSL